MKTLLLFAFLALTCAFPALAQNSPVSNSVYFADIKVEYKSFTEIKPMLVNNSNQSIHLQFIFPIGAKLKRLNEETGEWELGDIGITCGTGARPIEIKVGKTWEVDVNWQMSVNDFDNSEFYRLRDGKTLRPLEGTYKIFLSYALERWFFDAEPENIYTVESTQFRINPKTKRGK